MNLKPFRDIDEHEVINLFSTLEANVDKGTFVSIYTFDPDNHSGPGATLANVPAGAVSTSWDVYAKVSKSANTSGCIGITLCDVTGSNANVWTLEDQYRYFDRIPSGKAVPILKRGLVEINGFSGTAFPGAKGSITGTAGQEGRLIVVAPGTAANVGTFLSTTGADGYAIFQVNCI